MKNISEIIHKKRSIAAYYTDKLNEVPGLILPTEQKYAKSVFWMYHIVVEKEYGITREELMTKLSEVGIETRKTFTPFNKQNLFLRKGWTHENECPVSNYYMDRGMYIPTGPTLTEKELAYICNTLSNLSNI